MFKFQKQRFTACLLCLFIVNIFCITSIIFAQDQSTDATIIERYKLMLSRKPKEGSTFDRLYQFYLEGDGLDAMVTDYQAAAEAKPNDPNVQLILGHIYKRLGKEMEAVAAYQRAVELAPNNYYAHFALGQVYEALRQHEDAIRELTKAAALSEQAQNVPPEELTTIYKALGHAYFRRDRIDEAIQAWQKISELDPQGVFARIELADLFREQELYEQAIAQHEAIINLKKDDPYRICLSRREIGNIHEAKGDYQDAIKSYDAALALTAPGNWLRKDLQHRIIGIYAADSNWEGLIEYYQTKLETTPNEPELLGLLAAAYIENQQLDEGIGAYRKGVELAPTDATLRLNLITALRNGEMFADAAAEYEVLSEQDSDDFGIYRELGELYLQLEDENKARSTYQRMIDLDPQNATTYLILAEIYTGHEWLDDAAAQYEKAISLAPNNLDYIEYFGEFYFRQGNREKAIETWNQMVADGKGIAENYDRLARLLDTKAFRTEALAASRKSVELMPDVYRFHETLAKRLMANKNYDEALAEYAKAAKLAPNEFFAEKMDDQRIELYRRQGTLVEKIEAVETELEKSKQTNGDVFAQQKRLAKMYLKLGNITYALEVLLKAKALKPDDVVVNRWIADIYEQQGRRDDANAVFARLIEVDSANAREYHAKIARSYLNVMDFEEATAAAKKVVAHSPRNPEGHQLLADIAKQSGNYDTAIDSLKQAIRLRPEGTDIRRELAAIYKLSGKPQQAIAQYWRCWELSSSVSDKLAFVKPLSETYYDLGRRGELEEKLKQMAKTNTSDVAPILGLAQVYRMEDDLPKARFQLARALDQKRDNAELLSELVNISLDLGDNQDALSYQQRLVKADPDASHQQKLGELLFDAGREQEAIQAWTKLLHAKNQTLEAEVKLAILLIRYGLLDEALFVLDRAAEQIKGVDAHIALYQLGATLVEMDASERARPHFERILELPKPNETGAKNVKSNTTYVSSGPPGININKFYLARNLAYQIQNSSFTGRGRQRWLPKNFEEAQIGALVQLVTIVQKQGKLSELIEQFEADAAENPKDIQTLEKLAQIYVLIENTEKTKEITEKLIAASPNDATYQAIRLSREIQQDLDNETFEKYLNDIIGLTDEARLWYRVQYGSKLYREGKIAAAEKLLTGIENTKVTTINTAFILVNALVQMGKTQAAENVIANLPVPPQSQQSQRWQFQSTYRQLTNAYHSDGQTDKAVAVSWKFFERTKPSASNARSVAALASSQYSYGGYSPVQSSFPLPTTYFDRNRFSFLQDTFNQLWMKNQQNVLYTKLQSELGTAEGRDLIYPSLAMSYCYWWDGQRDKAQEILSTLEKEFPNDLTLKLNTVFVNIQTGKHGAALTLLDGLSEADPKNRRQYFDLTMQLAVHIGDTAAIRKLMTKLLNSPSGVREIYQFSKKLQEAGLTQYAAAVAKKTMTLAMRERDPNFLVELSQHLQSLGRGQDAALVAERALRFANQRDRYGRTLRSWNFQQATRLMSRSTVARDREPKLLEAIKKNPKSFQSQLKLASFYESTNQVKKASEVFKAALELRPKNSMTRQRYAQMLQRHGNATEAVTQYITLLENNPNVLSYYNYEVIDLFIEAGKVDELVSLTKKMILPAVGQNYANDFASSVARACMNYNNPTAAVEIYEKIIKVQPNTTYTYTYLLSAYIAAKERDKAIQILREKLETTDIYLQVQFVSKLTEIFKESDEINGLLTEYTEKLAENPEKPVLLYLLAAMKIVAKDLEGADPLVNQLLDMSSVNAQWLSSLAEVYRGANDRKREINLLEAAIKKSDTQSSWQNADVYQKLGEAYIKEDEKEKARDAFRKMGVLRIMQQSFYGKDQVAQIYMQHQMWDDAEVLLTELLNDLSVDQYYRQRAQERMMTLKQKRDGLTSTTKLSEETKNMNVGTQRALAQQYARGRSNDVTKAIEIYENIVKVMPEDFESRKQLATLYSRQNKHDKSIEIWNTLLEADPENTLYQDGLVNSYRSAGKFNEAFELAQKYIDAEPEIGVHYIRIAKLYNANDQNPEAIAAYQKAIEISPGNGQVYQDLAQLYLNENDFDAAEKAYFNAIQFTGDSWERSNIERSLMSLYRRQGTLEEKLKEAEENGTITFEMQRERARNFSSQDKLDEAVTAYKKALDMTSDRYDRDSISNDLLKIYMKLDKTDLALEIYETMGQSMSTGMSIRSSSSGVTVTFGNDRARETLINAYTEGDKLEELKTLFEDRLEKDANNPALLEMVADIYRFSNNYEKTAATYQALCKAQPSNVRSFFYAAAASHKNALHNDEQPELAKTLIEQGKTALSTNSRYRDRWFVGALATICYESGMYVPTIDLIETVFGNSGSYGGSVDDVLFKLLGQSYLATEQYEKAVEAYQNLKNIARSDTQRKQAEAALRQVYKKGNLYEKRIPAQEKKVLENPNDPQAHLVLAQSYEFSDKIDKAIAQYEKLSELQPNDPQWHKTIGNLYQKSRETDGVIQNIALELDGNYSFVEIGDSDTLNSINQQMTVSAWIKPTAFQNRYTPIIYKGDKRNSDISNRSFTLWLRDDGVIQFASSPNGQSERGVFSPLGSIMLNKWYHVAGVIDAKNDSIKLFIDGTEVGQRDYRGNLSIYESLLPLRIGGSHEEEVTTHATFAGQIDEVSVWGIALTAEQIRANMEKKLKGNEPGLVGLWDFDKEADGHISDTSLNKIDGKLIGNTKLIGYTRPVFTPASAEQLTKAAAAYERAIALEPTTYELYGLLAEIYVQTKQPADAEAIYRRALDANLSRNEYNTVLRDLSKLYIDKGQEEKLISFLQELKPKMEWSSVLHELLGDSYTKVGDSEKAELAYTQWLAIRQNQGNSPKQPSDYRYLAEDLLNKNLFPEKALKFAKRAAQNSTSSYYIMTLGRAYLVNEKFEEAFAQIKQGFNMASHEDVQRTMIAEITQIGKNIKNKEGYVDMLRKLSDNMSNNVSFQLSVSLMLAEFYQENNMHEEAKAVIRKTGFITEDAWMVLGPFENAGGIGFNTAYIPEDITEIDMTAKYEGLNGDVRWQKGTDDTMNGYISLGENVDWGVSYAFVTVFSPDEREVQFRFDSDDQGKVWVNTKEVFTVLKAHAAKMDRYNFPVTLKSGKNTILVKVCEMEDYWGFYLRITDQNGKPFEDLKIGSQ